MRNRTLFAGIALAALTPSVATAQVNCEKHRSGRIAATVGGGAAGALLGTAIAGRGDNTEGAIIGGVIGAIAGNQLAKTDDDCSKAYGWFDRDGRWHANRVKVADARGYYDRNGDWVRGRPTGYYDTGGRWVDYAGDAEAYGYVGPNGYWIPASASGYYDVNGRWVSGYSAGYYDSRGRWIAGQTLGRYDSRGRWIAGDPGYGNRYSWSEIEQPGYWSNGRWIAGPTRGYYDSRGRWVSYGTTGNNRDDQWADDRWDDMPRDLEQRIANMRDRVMRLEDRGRITRSEEQYALNELRRIEWQHRQAVRNDGRLSQREETAVRNRLDRLQDRVRAARQEARAY